VQNFNLINLWNQGDGVLHAITVLLIVMSLLTWIVIFTKAWDLMRIRRNSSLVKRSFWQATKSSSKIASDTDNRKLSPDPFAVLAQVGDAAVLGHQSQSIVNNGVVGSNLSLSDWLIRCFTNAIDESVENLQSGLSLLASIGSTAPFVGLLGTVWGIYHALHAIGQSSSATLDLVAGPVGEALIMTAFGLVVAIPAVLGHNALQRANKRITGQLNRFAHDLHAYYVTGIKVA
jgi:biopolymer transport protein ExbB